MKSKDVILERLQGYVDQLQEIESDGDPELCEDLKDRIEELEWVLEE